MVFHGDKEVALLTGLYKKAAYRISQLEMSKNEIIEFDLKEFKMDDIGEVANIVYESKRQSSLNLDFLKKEEINEKGNFKTIFVTVFAVYLGRNWRNFNINLFLLRLTKDFKFK